MKPSKNPNGRNTYVYCRWLCFAMTGNGNSTVGSEKKVKTERIWKHFLQGACTWKQVCAFFQCTQHDVTYGCSWPTSVGVNYAIIHTHPAMGKTLAKRERARCIAVEFICPAVAEVKWFSKSCPFQHCSSKADLWLRLQFTPFFSLLPPSPSPR